MIAMTNGKRDCFFISPIGKKDTPERINSDRVISLFLNPVLGELDFNTKNLRADQINAPRIKTEKQRRIQEDELCIVDLTDLDPNVLLECGYRLATGKPLIALKAEDHEGVPSDLEDVHVISYEYFSETNFTKCLDDANIEKTRNGLKEQIEYFIENGFSGNETVPASRLNRIDQKLEEIIQTVQLERNILTASRRNDKDGTIAAINNLLDNPIVNDYSDISNT